MTMTARPGMPPTIETILHQLADLMDVMDDRGMFGPPPPQRDREVQRDLRGLAAWFAENPDQALAAFDRMREWTLEETAG